MEDGLKSEQMLAIDMLATGSLTAGILSGAGLQVGAGEVGTAEIADSGVTAVKQSFVTAGSPPTGGYKLQMGESVLSGGSAWVVYPTAYVGAPKIVTGIINQVANFDNENTIAVGSIGIGSFIAIGSAADTTFSWLAVGSGTF